MCRLGARSPWRSTSTLDRTTPPVSRWLACAGVVALSSSGGCCTPVAWRAATRADTGPACGLGIGRPVALAEHLDTGQRHISNLEVVGLYRGCGAQLEWAGAAPPVARRVATRADTVPVCRLGLGRPVALAQHLDTGQHHTSSLEVVGLHRGCGAQLEWRVLHPP